MINEIRKFSTVAINYIGRLEDGTIFHSTYENLPEKFQVGTGKVLIGIEEAIMGKRPGDRLVVKIAPEDAYGYRDVLKIQDVERGKLPPDIKVGGEVTAHYEKSPNVWSSIKATIVELNEETAKVDFNHPLAGRELNFQIEIVDVLIKKKCAVFTIVKNEPYFLDIWLRHYKRFFDNEDIYVVDHQSDDGSTEGLDVNVKRIYNEVSCDWNWLVEQAEEFQQTLLQKYECVIYSDTDEMIYSHEMDLKEVVEEFLNSEMTAIKCVGYEIIQDLEKESPLKEGDSIIKNRNYWFRRFLYDKTLISKVPLKWGAGFHDCHNIPESSQQHSYGVTLCHLHRSDFERMFKKHERTKNWTNKTWTVTQRDEALHFFNTVRDEAGFEIKEIPEKHKIALYNI